MAEFFRFRRIDTLLGKFQKLEKQTIYFASPEELNDPNHMSNVWHAMICISVVPYLG